MLPAVQPVQKPYPHGAGSGAGHRRAPMFYAQCTKARLFWCEFTLEGVPRGGLRGLLARDASPLLGHFGRVISVSSDQAGGQVSVLYYPGHDSTICAGNLSGRVS